MLAGCGYVGPALPPALNIPKPVTDLQAEVIGDRIRVRFTPPSLTTENLPAELRTITLYAGEQRYAVPSDAADFGLNAADFVDRQLVLRIRTTGRSGRESDWSNSILLSVVAPLTSPTRIEFTNQPDALRLTWSGNSPRYRISRVVENKLEPLAETDVPEYVDPKVVMGTRYEYVVVGIAGENQQSLPSARFPFTPTDIFPPAVPSGLTAVSGGRSVDLSWTRSAEDDLAGFNIFRALGDGPLEPFAQNVPLPAFTDARVESGRRYRYAVSAVDTTGNESARSGEAGVQIE